MPARSRSSVLSLARPVYSAAAMPAGPAPMITTSQSESDVVPFEVIQRSVLHREYCTTRATVIAFVSFPREHGGFPGQGAPPSRFSGAGGSAPRGQSLLRSFLAAHSFPPRPPGYVLNRTVRRRPTSVVEATKPHGCCGNRRALAAVAAAE